MRSSQTTQSQPVDTASAARVLQKYIRRANVRRNLATHAIAMLPASELKSYRAFAVGNDPVLPESLQAYKVEDQPLAVVATSGLRAIKIACMLGAKSHPPKLYLVDNSYQVHLFWKFIKQIVATSKSEDDLIDGLEAMDRFNFQQQAYRDINVGRLNTMSCIDARFPEQDPALFVFWLLNQYGIDYVKQIVLEAELIRQSWLNKTTFTKLKQAIDFLKIAHVAVYASNIAVIQLPEEINNVLHNIQLLDPFVAVHSDICETHLFPHKIHVLDNQSVTEVKATLFSAPYLSRLAEIHLDEDQCVAALEFV